MAQYLLLDPETSPFFTELTFPNYRHLLQAYSAENYIAVGALNADDVAVGLLLVGLNQNEDKAHQVLSVYVDDEHRRQGIAGKMLVKMLDEMRRLALNRKLNIEYPDNLPSVEALERLFLAQGFMVKPNHLLTLRGVIGEAMSFVPDVFPLPEGLRFSDWQNHTESQKEQMIAYAQDHANTGAHSPFTDIGIPIHEVTSVLLCEGERVVGWMLNHEVEPNVVRYSRLFIAPSWRKQRLGVHCFFESMRRQNAFNPQSIATFAAESRNSPMLAVVEYFKALPSLQFTRVKTMSCEL